MDGRFDIVTDRVEWLARRVHADRLVHIRTLPRPLTSSTVLLVISSAQRAGVHVMSRKCDRLLTLLDGLRVLCVRPGTFRVYCFRSKYSEKST